MKSVNLMTCSLRSPLMWCAALCLLSANAQTTHELRVGESTFNPPYLSIQLGDHVRIVWDREVAAKHTFTDST